MLAQGGDRELQNLVPVRIPEVIEVSALNRGAEQGLTTDLGYRHREVVNERPLDWPAAWETCELADPGLFAAVNGVNHHRLLMGKHMDEALKHRALGCILDPRPDVEVWLRFHAVRKPVLTSVSQIIAVQ